MSKIELKDNEFQCYLCKGIFERMWSDEEAKKELNQNFRQISVEECSMICEDCYELIYPDLMKILKKEIVGYRLNGIADRITVDRTLGYAMPIWDKEDKSVYFIIGHMYGSLVQKAKSLKILDIWFEPIYKDE